MEKPVFYVNKKLDSEVFLDCEMEEAKEEEHAISLTKIMKEEKISLNKADMKAMEECGFSEWERHLLRKIGLEEEFAAKTTDVDGDHEMTT